MLACTACSHEVPDDAAFCPSCGSQLDSPSSSRPSSSSSIDRGTIRSGSVLAGRYRIVRLAGRGGMGEVYEADDLTLGQVVALKFLPESLSNDANALKHLFDEVRIARRVSHPNVARVYDIGEVDGRHFLSMEFVRGDDLGQVLKRIGRLPAEKALELAHQICAGLAAAHDQGVLHRDLKPSNVLLDSEGKVHLTDFGLAVLAGEQEGRIAGTPAYMAPEQIRGHTVTVRSEVYSLGVLLFELFTGKRVFDGSSFEEFARMHELEQPPSPSSTVERIDPQIERTLLQCLEKDPMRRPRSARSVSAELPGGDPLAAALAAGQTPAPEVVAAAGSSELWRPGVLVALFVACLVLAGLGMVMATRTDLLARQGLPKPPAVLAERARTMLGEWGYDGSTRHSASWFQPWWRSTRVDFVYRQAREPLEFSGPRITLSDPAPTEPGMIDVRLSPTGALRGLRAVGEEPTEPRSTELDWSDLVRAANLDGGELVATEPGVPPVLADRVAAWRIVATDDADGGGEIQAAAFENRPVWFEYRERTSGQAGAQDSMPAVIVFIMLFSVVLPVLGALMAWRNLRLGRGDRRGAIRVAMFAFVTSWIGDSLMRDHVASIGHATSHGFRHAGLMVFGAVLLWIGYMALEPYVRRKWPHALIPWTRLLARRFSDPLVGRDVLVGALCASALSVVAGVTNLAPEWLGHEPSLGFRDATALELRRSVGVVFTLPFNGMIISMICVLTLVWARILAGRAAPFVWVGLTALLVAAIDAVNSTDIPLWTAAVWALAFATTVVLVSMRFGLLALVVTLTLLMIQSRLPVTLDPSSWYFHNVVIVGAAIVGLSGWGLRAALAGRPLLRDEA